MAEIACKRPGISVLILTLNEQDNLPAPLALVQWSDDVHMLDCNSTDNTAAIAQAAGAKLWCREFDNFAAKRNWALDNIPFAHSWVFHADADGRVTPASLHLC